jgi:hypothetical protein
MVGFKRAQKGADHAKYRSDGDDQPVITRGWSSNACLGDDKAEVVCQAVGKPFPPVPRGAGMIERGLHPDLTAVQFDREGRHVVRPQVKSAAAFEIEAGVMPVTGQDAILDGTSGMGKLDSSRPGC